MKTITATLVNLYHVCKRELWLHANEVRMEHSSDIVFDGKLTHEYTYMDRSSRMSEMELQTNWKGQQISGKIDFYDAKNKVIHETKRGDKVENAQFWQVKFYIWLFELNGIEGVKGKIEYPKLRETKDVEFTANDREYLEKIIPKIDTIISHDSCPAVLRAKICKSCSYFDFCYADELEE